MISFRTIGIVGILTFTIAMKTARADWRVRNNLEETFTVYVWPTGTPQAIKTCTIRPGERCGLPLGSDTHEVELVSSGDDVYVLRSMSLRQRNEVTDLKTILTPQRREGGRTIYQYMNQRGFNRGDTHRLNDLKWSAWKTKYSTPNGGSVTTDLRFAGNVGTYNRGRGKLSEVTYAQRDGRWVISGNWVFDSGSNGQFEFFVNDRESRFSSTPNRPSSKWDGWRRWPRD